MGKYKPTGKAQYRQEAAWCVLYELGEGTSRDVAEALGMDRKNALKVLKRMVQAGRAERVKTMQRRGLPLGYYAAVGDEPPIDPRTLKTLTQMGNLAKGWALHKGPNRPNADPENMRQFRREGASSEIPSLSWADLLR